MTAARPTLDRTLTVLVFVASGIALLTPLPHAWEGGWRSRLLDLGHVPLFALLTALAWRLLGRRWLAAALAGTVVAALTEVAQHFVGRSATVSDFLHGAAASCGTGLLLNLRTPPRTVVRLVWAGPLGLALLGYPVAELGPELLDSAEGYHAFPTLADFAHARRLERWETRQADLSRVPDPDVPGGYVGRLEFRPGPADFPSGLFAHVRRDFTGYRRLCWSFRVEGHPQQLVISLRDGSRRDGTNHYQFGHTYPVGDHVARMDLAVAREKSEPGKLDMTDLWWSQIFTIRPPEAGVVYLRRVWLE